MGAFLEVPIHAMPPSFGFMPSSFKAKAVASLLKLLIELLINYLIPQAFVLQLMGSFTLGIHPVRYLASPLVVQHFAAFT